MTKRIIGPNKFETIRVVFFVQICLLVTGAQI